MPGGPLITAVATADRWLLALILAVLTVLGAGSLARRAARAASTRRRRGAASRPRVRRRAGILIALGPVIGLAVSPTVGEHAWLIALGAVALAVLGLAVERRPDADRRVAMGISAAAAIAVLF